jgi:cytochrome c556
MKKTIRTAVAAALVLAGLPAMAQFQKPEDAVKYRQSSFSVMAAHFGRLGAMANGRMPFDAKVAQDNAAIVEFMSKLPWAGFTPDSKSAKSRVKEDAWAEKAKFDQGAEKMMAEVVKLNAAAKTGNLDALKTAFGETAKTCKACHDAYREQ